MDDQRGPYTIASSACRRRWRWDVLVFAWVLLGFAWFSHGQPGWNVNSRLALSYAWAETGSPQVDKYVVRPDLETRDLAEYSGHLYSDKSIGTSLLAVPAVYGMKALESITDRTFSSMTRRWIITALSVGVAGALAAVLLARWLVLASGITPAAASLLAVLTMYGSMLLLYGSLFMSYLPATACLMACLVACERAFRGHPGRWALVAGLAGGLTILCEFIYGVAVLAAGVYLLEGLWDQRRYAGARGATPRSALGAAIAFGSGALIGIAPFLLYTWMIFGRIGVPYEYHAMPEFRAAMSRGFMGATTPDLSVLWLISFHPFRGIFFYSPLLLAGLLGLVAIAARPQLAQPHLRGSSLLALFCTGFYLIFNSAYYMWWGGWSFAPRHLAPAIPFLALGLTKLVQWRAGRMIITASAIISIGMHLMVVATEPQPPDGGWQDALLRPNLAVYDYPAVFMTSIWPRVATGTWEINAGHLAGLPGGWGVAVLGMLWMGAFIVWLRMLWGEAEPDDGADGGDSEKLSD